MNGLWCKRWHAVRRIPGRSSSLNGKQPTFEKRGAAVGLIMGSLRPGTYQRESFAGRKAGALNAERLAQMKEFVEMAMKKLDVPGVGVAFIDNGKIVYEGGHGVKELGKPDAVDANTLFMAASNTKGMTTLLLAKLVDEGKVKWDDFVTEAYPKFKLGDARDDRAGAYRAPDLRLHGAATPGPAVAVRVPQGRRRAVDGDAGQDAADQRVWRGVPVQQHHGVGRRVRGRVPVQSEARTGRSLRRGDEEEDLRTAGDERRRRSTTARALKGNHASPHSDDVDGKQKVASMDLNYSIHPHRPAGGVWTSAHDLIRYVQLELAKGKLPNGKVLVSETNLLARRKPYVKVGAYGSYGMGLQVDNRWGTPVVSHGGSMFGFKSDIMFLPEHGVGAVILTNADTGGLMLGSFRRRFLEVLFDGKPEAAEDLAKAAENYQSRSSQVPRAPGCACGQGGRRQIGGSLHKSRAGRACGSPPGIFHRLRSRRVAQLSGFPQKRRRHDLLHDH